MNEKMNAWDIDPLEDPDENSWFNELCKAFPHLSSEDLLNLLSRGNGTIDLEGLDFDIDGETLNTMLSELEREGWLPELPQPHLHLGTGDFLGPQRRGNGIVDPEAADTDVDIDLLSFRPPNAEDEEW
jgi:hypothetical protein